MRGTVTSSDGLLASGQDASGLRLRRSVAGSCDAPFAEAHRAFVRQVGRCSSRMPTRLLCVVALMLGGPVESSSKRLAQEQVNVPSCLCMTTFSHSLWNCSWMEPERSAACSIPWTCECSHE